MKKTFNKRILSDWFSAALQTSRKCGRWQYRMKINKRGLRTGLKMTSKSGITAFTIFGVLLYLLTFLGITFTSTEVMATRKILVGSIGGAILSGILIIAVLRASRYFLMKYTDPNMDIQ